LGVSGLLLASALCDERYYCIRQEFYKIGPPPVMIDGGTCIELFAFISLCRVTVIRNLRGYPAPLRPLPRLFACRNRPKRRELICSSTTPHAGTLLSLPIATSNSFPSILPCCWFCFKKLSHQFTSSCLYKCASSPYSCRNIPTPTRESGSLHFVLIKPDRPLRHIVTWTCSIGCFNLG
jgi:hypothetical protein